MSYCDCQYIIYIYIYVYIGFSTDGFRNFINSNGNKIQETNDGVYKNITARGEPRVIITLPTVVEKAQEFYGCGSLEGLELENWGLDGVQIPSSHWDNRVVLGDVMIPYVPLGPTYAAFTLAVFADSGWYDINWEYAQESTYGEVKDAIGLIINVLLMASQFDEFCSEESDLSCGRAQIGKFYCPIENWSSIPTQEQYFSDSTKGGDTPAADYCPIFKQ